MPIKSSNVYVVFGRDVWVMGRMEFLHFVKARMLGDTSEDGDGDLHRVGAPVRGKFGTPRSLVENEGYPREARGKPRFNMTVWTSEDYRNCYLQAMQFKVSALGASSSPRVPREKTVRA